MALPRSLYVKDGQEGIYHCFQPVRPPRFPVWIRRTNPPGLLASKGMAGETASATGHGLRY